MPQQSQESNSQKRLAAIFAMVSLLLALFGGPLVGMLSPEVGAAVGIIGLLLAIILGIISWQELIGKAAAIISIVFFGIGFLGALFFLISGSSGDPSDASFHNRGDDTKAKADTTITAPAPSSQK